MLADALDVVEHALRLILDCEDPGPPPMSSKRLAVRAAVSRLLANSPRITSFVKNSIPQLVW